MDFVVVGFGVGALGVLLGFALRDAGPRWRAVGAERPLVPGELVRRVAWGRACRAGGRVLALGGAAVCLATLAALVARVSDRTGTGLILTVLLLAAVGLIAWSAVYAHRFHPRPARRRSRPVADAAEQWPEPVVALPGVAIDPVPVVATAGPPEVVEPDAGAPAPLAERAAPPSTDPLETAADPAVERVGDGPSGEAATEPAADSPPDASTAPETTTPLTVEPLRSLAVGEGSRQPEIGQVAGSAASREAGGTGEADPEDEAAPALVPVGRSS